MKDSFSNGNTYDQYHFERLDLEGDTYKDIVFNQCTFKQVSLHKVKLHNVQFNECEFYNSDLSLIEATDCVATELSLTDCSAVGLKWNSLGDQMHLVIQADRSNLSHSDFSNLKLHDFSFIDCDLSQCRFVGTICNQGKFIDVDLQGSELINCKLSQLKLVNCANLECDLSRNSIDSIVADDSTGMSMLRSTGVEVQ